MDTKRISGSVIAVIMLLLIEFVAVPYSSFLLFPQLNGQSYITGLALMSAPRVVFVLCMVLLVKVLNGGASRPIAIVCYVVILMIKYSLSEVYVASNNLFALSTAVIAYLSGIIALIVSVFFFWRKQSEQPISSSEDSL